MQSTDLEVDYPASRVMTDMIYKYSRDKDLNMATSLHGCGIYAGIVLALSGREHAYKNLETVIETMRRSLDSCLEKMGH